MVQSWNFLEPGEVLTHFAHNPREKRKDSDTGFAHPELGFIRAVRNGKTLWEFQTPRGAGICNFAAGFFEEWNQYIISVTPLARIWNPCYVNRIKPLFAPVRRSVKFDNLGVRHSVSLCRN